MKTFEQFREYLREAVANEPTSDSWLVVDNTGKDKWIIDRWVPSNLRSGGTVGTPFKKKGQALKAAKKIARTTGEDVKIGRAWPKGGGPEVLRKKKS